MGNVRTGENNDASRFGRYTELQFSESGKLIGSKTLDYFLEKSRLVTACGGDGTFHILHAMVAGASADEKQHLRLGDDSDFRYLGGSRQRGSSSDDAQRFARLKQAFKSVNLSQRQVASICQILAAVLHLGNLDFHTDHHRSLEGVFVRNRDTLSIVSEFLGVADKALEEALTYRTRMIRGEVCTIVLDAEGAAAHRDELAKSLYSLLFSWVNEQLNGRLCRLDFDVFIGILDMPGPRTANLSHSFDDFAVNFANERLHRYMLASVFEKRAGECEHEGISHLYPQIPFFDNAECLRLITNQPGGLVHIMDDQARRMPKKTDQSMMEAFGRRWGSHADFSIGGHDRNGFATFQISHYHGPVTYSSEGWLEKNSETMSADFIALLKGDAPSASRVPQAPDALTTAQQGSKVAFVRSLFKTTAITTQSHPRSEKTLVAAQQSVKPIRAPSTRRPNRAGTVKRSNSTRKGPAGAADGNDSADDKESEQGGHKKKSELAAASGAAGELRSALDTLFETLDDTQAWQVLCLRPNDNQLPNQFEGRLIKQQLKSHSVTEIARKGVIEYNVSMTHDEFCERYAAVPSLTPVSMREASSGMAKQKFQNAKEVMNWSDKDAVSGATKVFLSHDAFRELEDELRTADEEEVRFNAKRNDIDAEVAIRGDSDFFSPFGTDSSLSSRPRMASQDSTALLSYGNPFQDSSSALPLVSGGETPMLLGDDKSEWMAPSFPSRSFDGLSRPGSVMASEAYAPSRNMFGGAVGHDLLNEKATAGAAFGVPSPGQTAEKVQETSTRRWWVRLTQLLTFFVPSVLLSAWGRLKRPDIRMAWREKLAINMMIWFVCGAAIFVVAVLGNLICPTEHVYSTTEVAAHSSDDNAFTSIRGEVFDLTSLLTYHRAVVSVVADDVVLDYAGQDSTSIFPVQVNALCSGINGDISPWVQLSGVNQTDANSQYHDFRTFYVDDVRPDWYYESMWLMRSNYRVGFVGYTPSEISSLLEDGSIVAEIDGGIYDVTDYVNQGSRGVLQAPAGEQAAADTNTAFMSPAIIDLFTASAGKDITKQLNSLPLSADVLAAQRTCLRNLFFIGKKDSRNSARCQFARYILLAMSIFMVSIIGFKFLAALQFSRSRTPENHDRFVICQVPCYTEGEESMRKTIDSLAALKYDDKRKLLFIICDGMIVGAGNDRPTPQIVLDILGVDPNLDPEPLSFLSVGEGGKQHNMAKIYSGLYECSGHVVPYLVVVKVGKPTERSRPGNRGKRDSQLVLMRFLNRVHFGTPMNPMELEINHHIKNIIGVNPSFYEYVLQVDADTEVDQWCLAHFVSAFINDKKIIGLCGETALSNAKKSFVTMLQVYEYYISHYLAKAFESLFGSVTCLPGCFSMFRIRSPDTHRPLFVANRVVDDYAENRVDTLHTKNLLTLGEDRYLTTLVLKHFGNYKTVFVRAGKALTAAPEEWSVLLSQRRRWINSTVHNLFELIKTPGLCGVFLVSITAFKHCRSMSSFAHH
jgi:chitin synthase